MTLNVELFIAAQFVEDDFDDLLVTIAHFPKAIDETRHNLLDAKRLLREKTYGARLFDAMIELYPNRLNQDPVWYGALGLLAAP